MLYDNTGHIFHAAVAHFDFVSVENLVEFVVFWEVFIDESDEHFCNVGLDIFLYGGLNHIIFFFLFLFRGVLFRSFVYKISSLYLLVFGTS